MGEEIRENGEKNHHPHLPEGKDQRGKKAEKRNGTIKEEVPKGLKRSLPTVANKKGMGKGGSKGGKNKRWEKC